MVFARFLRAAAFTLMGAFALAAQTLLFREYLVVYEGNELGAGFFFASWLGWVGAGALLAMAAIRLRPKLPDSFGALLALYPPAFAVELLLIVSMRSLAGVAPTDAFPTRSLFLWTLLTNAPVSLVTGFLFPVAAAAAASAKRVYVFECLGAFLGGGAITLALVLGGDTLAVMAAISALLALSGLLLTLRAGPGTASALTTLVLTASVALVFLSGPARRFLAGVQVAEAYPAAVLEEVTETPYRRLAVAEIGEQRVFLENGAILAAFPPGGGELSDAALLLAQPKRLDRVLLLGSGLESLAVEMLRYPVGKIVLFEPDREGLAFLTAHLPDDVRSALRGGRVETRAGDVRQGLEGRFDLVVVDVGDPDTALAARYFTREFYEQMRGVLAEGGVLATAITSAENYFGSEVTRYGASVLVTLESVFPRVLVTPGERAWFLTGDRATVDAAELEARLRGLAVKDRRFEPERAQTLLEPYRVEFAREVYGGVAPEEREGLVSTDSRPVTFLLNLLVLGRKEGSAFTATVLAVRRAGIWIFLLPFLAVLAVRLRYLLSRPDPGSSARFTGGYMLVVFGFASIALDILLLLRYQQRFGLLFLLVGLANALFMLGLTVGGALGAWLTRRVERGLAAIAGAAGGAGAIWAFALPGLADRAGDEVGFLALFLLTGVVCGAPFPLAAALVKRAGTGTGRAGAILESTDHLGGAVGAAVAGILLVPLFGARATAGLLTAVLLTAPILMATESLVLRMPLTRPFFRRMRSRLPTFPTFRTGFVLAAAVLAAAAISFPVRRELDRPLLRLSPERLRTVMAADHWREVEDPFVHYDAWNKEDTKPANHTLATRAVVDDVAGYGGPLNLLLSINRSGKIRRVSLLESKETPAYIRELPEFLSRMEGRDAGEELDLDELVSITGATVSCRAAVETVNRAKARVLGDLMGRPPPERSEPAGVLSNLGQEEAATLTMLLLAVPVFFWAGRRARLAFLVLVAAVLGVLYNQQFAAARVVELFSLTLPPTGNLSLFILVVGVLVLSVAFGQVYCGLLCPFGAVQEILGRLGFLMPVSPELDRRLRFLKHVVLAATVVAALLFGGSRVLDYDPLAVAFSFKADTLMWALIGLVLLLSLFFFRFWCRYLCPVGAFLSLFNRIALLRRLAPPKDYRRCDLGARSKLDLDCLHCNRCIHRVTEVTR